MPMGRVIWWTRRDVRLDDNAAFARASELGQVVPVFVFDRNILSLLDRGDLRVAFLRESLIGLDHRLREHGSGLLVRHGDPVEEIPAVAEALGAAAVVAGDDWEPYALKRDREVATRLAGELTLVKDHVVLRGDQVVQPDGSPYRVFTPYYKSWQSVLKATDLEERRGNPALLMPRSTFDRLSHPWAAGDLKFEPIKSPVAPGEVGARACLSAFERLMDAYGEDRNAMGEEGTSKLSVHLRFGTISIREAFRRAQRPGSGAQTWRSELAWREFYSAILFHFPHAATQSFKPEFRDLQWPGNHEDFEAWRDGRTGYPIVDAAMRCLNATGWMHNRARMVVASFLTKNLLVDWRQGEAHFASKLLDFDLASNNGGWQWCASTGTDAQPWFRVFNPILQSRKFDPEGKLIRRWCPELSGFADEQVHWPHEVSMFDQQSARCILGADYPNPIVEPGASRQRALEWLGALKRSVEP